MQLRSWNDTQTKEKIVNYVAAASDENSPDYVPPAERIAAFDNDGTFGSSSRRPPKRSCSSINW